MASARFVQRVRADFVAGEHPIEFVLKPKVPANLLIFFVTANDLIHRDLLGFAPSRVAGVTAWPSVVVREQRIVPILNHRTRTAVANCECPGQWLAACDTRVVSRRVILGHYGAIDFPLI